MTHSARFITVTSIALNVVVAALILFACQSSDSNNNTFAQDPGNGMAPDITSETVTYKHGDTELEGFAVYPGGEAKRPAVLIVHQWMGLTDYERGRARQLAELGYVAFAVDIYGKGVRPKDQGEASAESGKYRGDRDLLRKRVAAGLDWIKAHARVDASRIVAIGYCFGGGAALELARSGADIQGVVSFHGNLDTPNPDDATNIRCPVSVHHGADDPFVNQQAVTAFIKEMQDADVDWYLTQHGNSVHSFTHEEAGNDNSAGAAYNAKADARSWAALLDFLDEQFAK